MKTKPIQKLFKYLLATFMLLAGLAHLLIPQAFEAQVPQWLPQNSSFVLFVIISSGIVEIALGLFLIFIPKWQAKIGVALALLFVLVFPGNISQYTNEINAFGLDTDFKRLLRLFFQPVLIAWALWSTGGFVLLKNWAKRNR